VLSMRPESIRHGSQAAAALLNLVIKSDIIYEPNLVTDNPNSVLTINNNHLLLTAANNASMLKPNSLNSNGAYFVFFSVFLFLCFCFFINCVELWLLLPADFLSKTRIFLFHFPSFGLF
jgi:hypothetical protein